MERTQVTSSSLRSIGYDADAQILEIEFKTSETYQYFGVSEYEHRGILNAESKGKYFNANIKDRYLFIKL